MLRKILLLLSVTSLLIPAQTKIPITLRLVEKGTTTGIPKGEKIVFYTPKGTDTLLTTTGGNVGGSVTDVKGTEATANKAIVRITREGRFEGVDNIKQAKLYNILGEEIADLTKTALLGKNIPLQNLAAGIYLISIEEQSGDKYALKLFQQNGLVYGSSVHSKVVVVSAPNKLLKTSGATVVDSIVVLDSYNVARTRFDGFTSTASFIDIGTRQVTGKVSLNIIAYGVDADSGKAPYRLSSADVWTGTRDLSAATYKGKTDANGTLLLRTRKGYTDTLFIQAAGHHQRNLLVNTGTDKSITEYAITDKIDIDFYNLVYLRNNKSYPGAKPSDKWGSTVPFYLKNSPSDMWTNYVTKAIAKISETTGGKYIGEITTDSTKAYGEITWKIYDGMGGIYFNRGQTYGDIESVEITFNPVDGTMCNASDENGIS